MKNLLVSVLCLSLLVFALAGTSYGWQGRMGGMGDPYGLISDESDFLIHPSGIAKGEGVEFYGNYRFTYRNVQDWDYNIDVLLIGWYSRYKTSGDEQTHDALVGAAVPLGPGRMGIFFEYMGMAGDYDGDVEVFPPFALGTNYDLSSDLDNFALRLLYGLPVGGFNLGGEMQLAYCQEENEMELMVGGRPGVLVNGFYGSFNSPADFYLNLFPFMTPYDSSYFEALLKGSLGGSIGPVETAFTLRGGFIFAGDNQLAYSDNIGFLPGTFDLDGDVDGWRLGGDLWLGFSLGDGLSLPFLMRIDYQEKSRDGDGQGGVGLTGINFDYKNKESIFELEAGGGVAKEFAGGTRLAAGIYYNYLDAANDFELTSWPLVVLLDRGAYPDCTEHRFQVKLAGDFPLADSIALQFGMNFFYGWMKEHYTYYSLVPDPFFNVDDVSLDGSRWGFGFSLGTSVALQRLTLEPFVSFGYQEINLDGDGTTIFSLAGIEMNKATEELFIGTGLSVLFDL